MNVINTKLVSEKMMSEPVDNQGYYVRMQGDAMLDAGINDNDLLRVTPGAHPEEGSIVLAMVRQDLVIRRYFKNNGRTILMADNVDYPSMLIEEYEAIEICGVVEPA